MCFYTFLLLHFDRELQNADFGQGGMPVGEGLFGVDGNIEGCRTSKPQSNGISESSIGRARLKAPIEWAPRRALRMGSPKGLANGLPESPHRKSVSEKPQLKGLPQFRVPDPLPSLAALLAGEDGEEGGAQHERGHQENEERM